MTQVTKTSKEKKDYSMAVSNNLRKLMKERNIGCKELSMAIKLPYSTINQIIIGGRISSPSIGTILPLAQYFKTSIEQLMDEELFIKTIDKYSENQFIKKTQEHALSPILFELSAKLSATILSKCSVLVSSQLAFSYTQELYYYSLHRGLKKPDEGFADWYYENNIAGLL